MGTPNNYLTEGRQRIAEGDWVEGIRSLSWAHDIEPDRVEIYLALIDAYERCAAEERDHDVLQQAFNVCRDLRDRRLPMTPGEQRTFYLAFRRVRDSLVAARREGWRPPPTRDEMRSLADRQRRG